MTQQSVADRWGGLDPTPPPAGMVEPERPMLLEYVSGGRAIITSVQAVKHAAKAGQGEPLEQAIAIMMESHWTSVADADRIEGIRAWNEQREPYFLDPDR